MAFISKGALCAKIKEFPTNLTKLIKFCLSPSYIPL